VHYISSSEASGSAPCCLGSKGQAAIIIPVLTQHYAMLQRNLLYTGVTRGKRLVVLVGQKKAVAIAVRNASGRRRWSKLQDWLRLGSPV
jgi:exodeoxyribonuclease V alpha subunit